MRIVHIQIALTHDVEEISIEKLIYGLFLWNNNFLYLFLSVFQSFFFFKTISRFFFI